MSAPAARAVRVHRFGPPEVMEVEPADPGEPGPGQALVTVRVAGVNYMDVAGREGFNPSLTLPATLGVEGSGVIKALGPGVDHLAVGERVAWYYVPGSYADRLIAPAAALVPVPDGVDDETAAGLLMQGLTAQHLAALAVPGDTVLVHSAAGGVGSLVTQLLTAAGVVVIGRVSSAGKAEAARRAGARHVLIGRGGGFAERVRDLTGGSGVRVVLDGTGAETFQDSLKSLTPHGVYAYYGGADGRPDPVDLTELPGSVLVTHPVVMDHVPTREDLLRHAAALFTAVGEGALQLSVSAVHALDRAADAHRALSSRTTTGKLLLRP